MTTFFDVVVAGGGPAGAFTARELVRAGCSVLLVDPAIGRDRVEGLSARVVHLLKTYGLDDALAHVSAPVPRSVDWAGLQNTPNGESLVRRPAFDAALRQSAIADGVVLERARVRRVLKADPKRGVELLLSTGTRICSRLMVDARGRQAPSSRRLKGPQTLSISGRLKQSVGFAGCHVASAPDGWLWCADLPGFGRWLQISIEADDLAGHGQRALRARLDAFLSAPRIRELVGKEGMCTDEPLLARAAGLVLAAPKLSLPVFPVGDAAVALDPLSGHGLFWALSSALAAVPSLLTVLEGGPSAAGLAERFYKSRVVDTFWRQARVGRDFYRLEETLLEQPFWAKRAGWPDNRPAHTSAARVRFEERVVVVNNRLALRTILITPEDPDGVAFVAGIPVRDLAEIATVPSSSRHTIKHSPAALSAARSWLDSRGLFKNAAFRSIQNPITTRETA